MHYEVAEVKVFDPREYRTRRSKTSARSSPLRFCECVDIYIYIISRLYRYMVTYPERVSKKYVSESLRVPFAFPIVI